MFRSFARSLLAVSVACTLLLAPLGVGASSAEAKRLAASRAVERYEVSTPYSSQLAGAARAHVSSNAEATLGRVLRFNDYKRMIPRFDDAYVVARDAKAGTTDVYMKVPVLKGTSTIWGVIRFERPRKVGDNYVVEGHMISGNVRRFDAKYIVEKIDDKSSVLKLEMLVLLYMPFPGSMVTSQLAGAAQSAVGQMRPHLEK